MGCNVVPTAPLASPPASAGHPAMRAPALQSPRELKGHRPTGVHAPGDLGGCGSELSPRHGCGTEPGSPLLSPGRSREVLRLNASSPFPEQTHPPDGMAEEEEDLGFKKNNNKLVKIECSWGATAAPSCAWGAFLSKTGPEARRSLR